jgi:hypothetical protein
MASATYSTKRNVTTSGVTKAPVANLTSILGTPLMPTTPEILERYEIQSPRKTYVIYFAGAPDILHGDTIVFGGTNYPVRGLGPWPTDNSFYEIIVEETQ